MAASYEEFKTEHRREHQQAFNRWCATVGNALGLVGIALVLLGRRRLGAALFASDLAVLAAGHAAEGTLSASFGHLARHPVWGTRADIELGLDNVLRRA